MLVSGLALSRIVDGLIAVAAAVAVLDQTQSPGWVAAVAAARITPMAVLGVLVVAAVQVADQRLVLVVGALIRMMCAAALVPVAQSSSAHPVWIVVAVAVAGLGGTPHRAAAGRLIATQSSERRLMGASTAFWRADYGSVLVAPGLCGLLLIVTDLRTTFVVTAVLALLLAVSVAFIPPDQATRQGTERALRQVGSAARLVLALGDVRSYIAMRAAARTAFGIIGVVIALLPERAGEPNAHIAFLQAALGVGAMLIAIAPGRVPDRGGLPVLLVSALALAVALVGLGAARPLILASLALVVIGAADLAVHLAAAGALQRSLPGTASAAGSGVADSVVAVGTLIGTLACPGLIYWLGIEGTCDVAAALVVAVAILLLPGLRRADAVLDAQRQSAAPVEQTLEGCAMLEGISQVNLEQLAAAATTVIVRRGALAIAEGGEPDAVYVVRGGGLHVHVAGEDAHSTGRLARLGPGDLFGEIAVLRGRPRTASVLAVETSELIRIPAGDFLAAIVADLGTGAGLYTQMEERLNRSHR